jgi:hypothetical protein
MRGWDPSLSWYQLKHSEHGDQPSITVVSNPYLVDVMDPANSFTPEDYNPLTFGWIPGKSSIALIFEGNFEDYEDDELATALTTLMQPDVVPSSFSSPLPGNRKMSESAFYRSLSPDTILAPRSRKRNVRLSEGESSQKRAKRQ